MGPFAPALGIIVPLSSSLGLLGGSRRNLCQAVMGRRCFLTKLFNLTVILLLRNIQCRKQPEASIPQKPNINKPNVTCISNKMRNKRKTHTCIRRQSMLLLRPRAKEQEIWAWLGHTCRWRCSDASRRTSACQRRRGCRGPTPCRPSSGSGGPYRSRSPEPATQKRPRWSSTDQETHKTGIMAKPDPLHSPPHLCTLHPHQTQPTSQNQPNWNSTQSLTARGIWPLPSFNVWGLLHQSPVLSPQALNNTAWKEAKVK